MLFSAALLAVGAIPCPAFAGSSVVGLETAAAFRNTYQETAWSLQRDQLYEESVQATLDSYIIHRALAAYHLGFALDHSTTMQDGRRADRNSWRYDAQLDLWSSGTVPVNLWANRQFHDTWQADVPRTRARSDSYGYNASIRGEAVPRLDTRGDVQNIIVEDSSGAVSEFTNSSLQGQLLHMQNRLVARGSFDRRRHTNPATERQRDLTAAEVFADYRVDAHTAVTARANSRTYETQYGDETVLIGQQYSDALVRWQPDPSINGNGYYRVRRNALQESQTGATSVGTAWSWGLNDHTLGSLVMGVDDTYVREPANETRLTGQHANTNVVWNGVRKKSSLTLASQGGAAHVQEKDVGSGVQTGAGASGAFSHSVGVRFLRVSLSGGGSRQWDTSPRALSYYAWNWNSTLETRQINAVSFGLQTSEAVVDQLSQEEGNSDRFQTTGIANFRLHANARGSYGAHIYRDVLDGEFASGLGHSFKLNMTPFPSLGMAALYHYSVYDHSQYAALWSHRVELMALYDIDLFDLRARYTRSSVGGRVPGAYYSSIWFELSRSFGWTF